MLETSQTTFWYILAGSIGLIAIVSAWMLYYVVRLLKNAVYTVEKFTKIMKKADEVLDMAKDKLHSSSTYLALGANAVKSIIEMVQEKKAKPARKRKTAKKNK